MSVEIFIFRVDLLRVLLEKLHRKLRCRSVPSSRLSQLATDTMWAVRRYEANKRDMRRKCSEALIRSYFTLEIREVSK